MDSPKDTVGTKPEDTEPAEVQLNLDDNPEKNLDNPESTPTNGLVEECSDPYLYTTRNEFTSELFKIELLGLPRFIGYTQMKKLLTKKMRLKPHKIKVTSAVPKLVFVTFRCEEDREVALKTICDFTWKGCKLTAKKANPMADPLIQKRKATLSCDAEVPKKKTKIEEQVHQSVPVMVKNAITPLWNLSYEEQLKDKQKEMMKLIFKLTHALKNAKALQSSGDAPCCSLLPIIASPITTGYRNKCEFNVGLHPESGLPTVGFRISSYKEGSKSVAEASHCNNIPDIMHKAAELFQEYVRASSLPVFNPEDHQGYWRQLTVRTSCKNHLLLIVVFHPQNLSEIEIEEEKQKLKEFFVQSTLGVTSLYVQRFVKRQKDDPPLEHIFGSTFIEEELLGLTFRISPDAFFQVNTLGAELLYKTVQEFATLTEDTTVLDLCCGTGTIGISLAKNVSKVFGVELCSAAVADASHNTERNGIDNAEFVCAKVEDTIFDILRKADEKSDIVAILDPPRAGISNKVIKAIRGKPRLKRLVYLSCSPQLALTNFVDLCRPVSNNYQGAPFRPVKAVAMDLFPQTSHCELVFLFERE